MTDPVEPVTLKTIARLHNRTTLFHAFVYFAAESAQAATDAGIGEDERYFVSRAAPLGPVSAEVVIATFYNWSPDLIVGAMKNAWTNRTPAEAQASRWRGAQAVLDATVAPVMSSTDIDEAIDIAQAAVDQLDWAARPLAAANAAVLDDLDSSEFASDRLVRLWQLVTVLREWRGDAHIALLAAEPLDPAECTVVSAALMPEGYGHRVRQSRAWSDADWDAAMARLIERGWVDSDGALTAFGTSARTEIETRTNELSAGLWTGMDDARVNRLGDLLKPGAEALRQAGYFTLIGLPPRTDA